MKNSLKIDDNGWPEYANLVMSEIKRLGKWCSSLDNKLDNHVTGIEHRLTKIETKIKDIPSKEDVAKIDTTLKNMKWFIGITLTLIIGVFIMLLRLLIG